MQRHSLSAARRKRRVVIDLRYVNEHIYAKSLNMKNLTTLGVRASWLFHGELHLQSARLYHIAMHEESVPYLGFSFNGEYFYARRCPSG